MDGIDNLDILGTGDNLSDTDPPVGLFGLIKGLRIENFSLFMLLITMTICFMILAAKAPKEF